MLASVGVAVGLILGILVALVVANGSTTTITLDWKLPMFAVATSLGISAIGCLIPAILAARLEPASALRQ